MVFQKLVDGQYDDLHGLVENDLLQKLKKYFSQLPYEKRKLFEFNETSHAVTQFDYITINKEKSRPSVRIAMRYILMAQKKDDRTTIKLEDLLAE